MLAESDWDRRDPKTCQDCAGIGRVWIDGLLHDCPECGGRGWESALAALAGDVSSVGSAPAPHAARRSGDDPATREAALAAALATT